MKLMEEIENEVVGIVAEVDFNNKNNLDYSKEEVIFRNAVRLVGLVKEWATQTLMDSHRDGCALYKGEQTDSCDCTVDQIVNEFALRVDGDKEELPF